MPQGKPKAFYLTPTLQAPKTITLSRARRMRIAEIAARHGVVLIEDDVFGPLKREKPRRWHRLRLRRQST